MVDFARVNHLTDVFKHDYDDGRGNYSGNTIDHIPGSFIGASLAILRLPVPTWTDPGTVSGEIDRSKGKSMSQVLGRIDAAKKVEDRYPFLPDGTHEVVVLRVYEWDSTDHGASVGGEFLCLNSTGGAVPGQVYANLWMTSRKPNFKGDTQELDRFVDFAGKAASVGDDLNAAKWNAKQMMEHQDTQPARGIRLKVHCATKEQTEGKGANKRVKLDNNGKPKTFSTRVWESIPQTAEDVVSAREEVDKAYPMRADHVQAAPPPPPPPPPPTTPTTGGLLMGVLGRK
jgi:hypothetical protein